MRRACGAETRRGVGFGLSVGAANRADRGGRGHAVGNRRRQDDLQQQGPRKLACEQRIAVVDRDQDRADHDRVSGRPSHDGSTQGDGEKCGWVLL